jgi:hypothetical protein
MRYLRRATERENLVVVRQHQSVETRSRVYLVCGKYVPIVQIPKSHPPLVHSSDRDRSESLSAIAPLLGVRGLLDLHYLFLYRSTFTADLFLQQRQLVAVLAPFQSQMPPRRWRYDSSPRRPLEIADL